MSKEEENQFGLVYDGAITENEIGKVNIHSNKLKEFYEPRKTQQNRKIITSPCGTRCGSCTWLY